MKKHLAIVAAAVFAIGGTTRAWAGDVDGQSGQSTVGKAADDVKQTVHDDAVKVGLESADQASATMTPHAAKIHSVLGTVAEKSITKDGNTGVADQFAKADRERLDQNKDALKNDDTLNGRIAEFQKDWKAKYNSDFEIKDNDKVFNVAFASIDEMPADAAARTASGTVAGDAVNGSAAAPATPPPAAGDTANATADNVKDTAQGAAIVHIPASHGMPAIDVPFVYESGKWRINIPDTVDSAKLKSNIQTALTDLDEKKDQWPADVDDGYRAVTHRLLLAIFDMPATDNGAAAPPAAPADATPKQ